MLNKLVRTVWLYDFYGNLLTPKQKNIMELYYHQDLSLGEIANLTGVSRQAIYDLLKRVQVTLEEYEEKLGYLSYHFRQQECVEKLIKLISLSELNELEKRQILDLLDELLKFGY